MVLALSLASTMVVPPASTADDPAVVGQWSPVVDVGIVPIHASLLPDGRVLFFNSTGQVKSWNPSTGALLSHPNNFANIFCSAHSFMPDGRLFVAGGHISDGVGPKTVCVFDYRANSWTKLADMNAGRWYPTCTTLANGEMLVIGGSITNEEGINRLPQVYQANGAVRDLDNAWLYLPLYSFIHAAPNGRVFNSAPYQRSRSIATTGTGAYSTVGDSSFGYRDAGTSVMYDSGKVMIVGGHDPPTETVEVIDLNQPTPEWRSVASLPAPRRQLDSTVLPDGKVLVTGGTRLPGFNNPEGAMLTGELWDPATEAWTTTAAMQTMRLYHSTSLLLPDGRVMCGGGGEYSVGDTTPHPNVEFYSPPYLFKGPRPTVTTCPTEIGYGQNFTVVTPNAAGIAAVTAIRLGSVTHGFDMSQRLVRLPFSVAAGALSVTAPANGNSAPPGHYMLFILNGSGVPSIARIVRISSDPLPQAPAAPTNLTATASSSKLIRLVWSDRSNDEIGFRIERSTDGATFDLLASVGAGKTLFDDSGLTPNNLYIYRVCAFNDGGSSQPSNNASARTLTFDPTGTGLIGEYFNESNFTKPALARVDSRVAFRWGTGSPAAGVDPNSFSVRWRGDIQPRFTETYTFRVTSDESARLLINGKVVVDDSASHTERSAEGTIPLVAGQRYAITLELREFTGAATCILAWRSASQTLEKVSAPFLYPAGLIGTYFDNPDFTGQRLQRADGSVDFNWGTNGPVTGMAAGGYSVRWKGAIVPTTTETYTLSVACSGAVRLYVDGKLHIDAWNERGLTELSANVALVAGKKVPLVLEYGETSGSATVRLQLQSQKISKRVIPRAMLVAL